MSTRSPDTPGRPSCDRRQEFLASGGAGGTFWAATPCGVSYWHPLCIWCHGTSLGTSQLVVGRQSVALRHSEPGTEGLHQPGAWRKFQTPLLPSKGTHSGRGLRRARGREDGVTEAEPTQSHWPLPWSFLRGPPAVKQEVCLYSCNRGSAGDSRVPR